MISLNREELKDKIHACWIGKNIGGTMGTPYEGKKEMQDISGFNSEKGAPLPNDDLDLQLVFLLAMEEYGPWQMSPAVLAEYWLTMITPNWNEYGIGKSNARAGWLPPMSGEINNETWRHSNGAWIRSEIWACLAPGYPEIACRYAFMDASVDHGYSEGSYAEIFTAALESMAFAGGTPREMIDRALTFLPEDCRVYRCVKRITELYDKGVSWQDAREITVDENKDLGWFQAPGNLAFVTIGLLYGEGDFKKSMIYAIDCGDDTDCTGATVGAILGILNGTKGIPKDWQEYIGDEIRCICINGETLVFIPKSCAELTERVLRLMPSVFKANGVNMDFTDGKTDFNIPNAQGCAWNEKTLLRLATGGFVVPKSYFNHKRYSYEAFNIPHTSAYIEFDEKPEIAPGGEVSFTVYFKNKMNDQRYAYIDLHLPEGFRAEYDHRVIVDKGYGTGHPTLGGECHVTVFAGDTVRATNRILLDVQFEGKATCGLAEIVLGGK